MLLSLALIGIGCKGENKTDKNPNGSQNMEKSTVYVNMEGSEYSVDVNCAFFAEDYFYFKSDKLETTDTNGDGIVITGHQQNQKMILTLIVEGKTYSAANFGIKKTASTAIGEGKLFAEGSAESFDTSYKVTCN